MQTPPPYLQAVKILAKMLERMREAGAPPKFSNEFLKTTLGFASSNDRAIIPVLKGLGFITDDGTPTDRYHDFRSAHNGGRALAQGLREGWASIFLSDEKANEKTSAQLKEIFKTVTGKSESVADKMAATFKALCEHAIWTPGPVAPPQDEMPASTPPTSVPEPEPKKRLSGELSLSQDIHVHLPPSSEVSVYKAIFRALREELLD